MSKVEWWEILESFESFEKSIQENDKVMSNSLCEQLKAQLLSNDSVPEALMGDWIWSRMYEYLGDYGKAYEYSLKEIDKIKRYLKIKTIPLIKEDYDEESLERSKARAKGLKACANKQQI